jgi:predicted O-methyltransferase YrrM
MNFDIKQAQARFMKYQSLFPDPIKGGGMHRISAAVWSLLLEWQRAAGVTGDLMEIGVWQGHGAAMLNLHRAPEDHLVLLDKFMSRENFINNIEAANATPDPAMVFYHGCSLAMNRRQALDGHRDSIRFIHIDAEHSFEAVVNDLDLCAPLLVERGMIAVDDFFMYGSPSITEAVFYWLERNREKLILFLTGFNKAYLCSPRILPSLVPFVYEFPFVLEEYGMKVTLCSSGWANEKPYFGLAQRANGTHQRIGKVLKEPSLQKMIFGE